MVEGICARPKIVLGNQEIYQGAFVGDTISEDKVAAFEKISGESLDIGLKFLAFTTGLEFPRSEAEVMAKRGGAIFIKLEPWSWQGKDDQSFTLENLLKGKYDHLLKTFAEGARKFGKPLFVSFAHEMNGTWYPWSGNPEQYVKAYRYVHDKISKEYGAGNLTWVWNPNIDFGNLEAYYPGKEYVDWVAADGYNTVDWGADWRSCSELFSGIIAELESFGKSIMIGEFASDANTKPDEEQNKPAFISHCINSFAEGNMVKAFVYFNLDKTEGGLPKKWAITTPSSKEAYQQAIKNHEDSFKKNIQFICEGEDNGIKELPASPDYAPPVVEDLSVTPAQPEYQVIANLEGGNWYSPWGKGISKVTHGHQFKGTAANWYLGGTGVYIGKKADGLLLDIKGTAGKLKIELVTTDGKAYVFEKPVGGGEEKAVFIPFTEFRKEIDYQPVGDPCPSGITVKELKFHAVGESADGEVNFILKNRRLANE